MSKGITKEIGETFSTLMKFNPVVIIGLFVLTLTIEVAMSSERVNLQMKFFLAVLYIFSFLVFSYSELWRIEHENQAG